MGKIGKSKKDKEAAVLQGISIDCPAKGLVTLNFGKDVEVETGSRECEICGTESYVKFNIRCLCGETHVITIKDW